MSKLAGFNLATVHEAVSASIPQREALVFRDRRLTYAELTKRTRQLAGLLKRAGVREPTSRNTLSNWESGQSHVALYMHNGNEYLESMLGCFKARAVPFNVNYRYVAEELRYLLDNAGAEVIIYHARFAPVLVEVLSGQPSPKLLLQVSDESGNKLLPGALEYEAALASADSMAPTGLSPQDLYILYTGGTTGMPKGVLWQQCDILTTAMGGRKGSGEPITSLDEFAARAARNSPRRYLPTPPFMHGTAQWIALSAWHGGHTVVIQDDVAKYDPTALLEVIAREQVNVVSLVGDAFGRPFIEALDDAKVDVSCLTHILNGGAAMTPPVKAAILNHLPGAQIVDTIGSSETGPQARHIAKSGKSARAAPKIMGHARVLSADLSRIEPEGHAELGWFAQTGKVPLGYLGDEAKTNATFPVVDRIRYSVPGDRVRLLVGGDIEFHGRDSNTINSGGEKIFVEEVEAAMGAHAGVADVLVSSRPSERWGREVVAIVCLKHGATADVSALKDEAAKHIARYKLPKAILIVDEVQRKASGKPDYKWAAKIAEASA